MVEYQREGYDMFNGMLDAMKEEAVGFLFNVTVEAAPAPAVGTRRRADRAGRIRGRGRGQAQEGAALRPRSAGSRGVARQGN